MRLSISNIAWDVCEDEAVLQILARHGVDAIDVAPGKYFSDPAGASEDDITRVKNWWASRGIEITGMQALLYGTTGLNMFGPPEVQKSMLDHLSAMCRIGAGLGAPRLVFGSPKNRDRTGLADQDAIAMAVSFFQRLGDLAHGYGVVICLEPNPRCYGANFMTTSAETSLIVEAVAHPAIKMQLDTGALTINHEDAESVLATSAKVIGHIHASEPQLKPLGDCETDHQALASVMAQYLPHHVVTVEMIATKDESHVVSVERALAAAVANYGLKW